MQKQSLFSVLTSGLLLLLAPATLHASVGKVIYAAGVVSVERGTSIALSKGDTLEEGDTIVTEKRGRAQLLMLDGARISVRSDTRLVLETYRLEDARASAIATSDATQGEVALNLLKGGLRTITGAIGKAEKEDYTLRTPVATLGIRGTDYNIRHCD